MKPCFYMMQTLFAVRFSLVELWHLRVMDSNKVHNIKTRVCITVEVMLACLLHFPSLIWIKDTDTSLAAQAHVGLHVWMCLPVHVGPKHLSCCHGDAHRGGCAPTDPESQGLWMYWHRQPCPAAGRYLEIYYSCTFVLKWLFQMFGFYITTQLCKAEDWQEKPDKITTHIFACQYWEYRTFMFKWAAIMFRFFPNVFRKEILITEYNFSLQDA